MTSEAEIRPGLSPTDALRRIEAILADRSMSPAARIAAAAVVLRADNETGEAWPGFRWIRERYGVSPDAIAAALSMTPQGPNGPRPGELGAAVGRHVLPVRRGPHGVQVFRVPALTPTERCQAASAPVDEALPGASAPVDEALPGASAPVSGASAPVLPAQRSGQPSGSCCYLAPSSGERGREDPPLPPGVPPHGNGDGNGQADDAALLKIAFPGGPSEKQRAALLNALAEARRAGADEPALWLALRRATTKPWLALARLAERLARQRAKARAPAPARTSEPACDLTLGACLAALAPRLAGLMFLRTDGARAEVQVTEGNERERGLAVREWAPGAPSDLGLLRRLASEEDVAAYPDLKAAVLAQGAAK